MKRITFFISLCITAILVVSCGESQRKTYTVDDIKIIPMPQEIEMVAGHFRLDQGMLIGASSAELEHLTSYTAEKIALLTRLDFKTTQQLQDADIQLIVDNELVDSEGYILEVNQQEVIIKGKDLAGVNHGVQSLLQLLTPSEEKNEWSLPSVTITDVPRFGYRGLMLDVSRHFFKKEFVLKTLNAMAMHKLNTLHLHLIDDQGWRMEIKKYPKLTEIGAWRNDREDRHWNNRQASLTEKEAKYGGFYTQEELKEIVAHAQKLGIDVIPEIEMPAHIMSAIASYPDLSCLQRNIEVPSGGVWPITDIYCAGKESTFEFLEDVLDEVITIFPSPYIHIGGDEATKTNWENCPHCKKRMRDENLHDVEELQSYFVKRMERYINAKGKKLIGWDEILEGGLAPDATVMSWRGTKGGVEAAKQGHDVIMTPTGHCYFDYYQGPQNMEPLAIGGNLPLSKVYTFDPVVAGMTDKEAAHVLGGQANLWTEYVPTPEHAEYMLYPRLAALAEAVWSNPERKDWASFAHRLPNILDRYNKEGVNYATSSNLVRVGSEMDLESKNIKITLETELPASKIKYALGNAELTAQSADYIEPLNIKESTLIKAAVFKNGAIAGAITTQMIEFHKAVGKSVTYHIAHDKKYVGSGAYSLTDVLRGSANFGDGKWQAWLDQDMDLTIDLGQVTDLSKIRVGCLENQGPDIYFPIGVEASVSKDNSVFEKVGSIERPYTNNPDISQEEFTITFPATQARYVRVKASILPKNPNPNRGVWLFVDEILIN